MANIAWVFYLYSILFVSNQNSTKRKSIIPFELFFLFHVILSWIVLFVLCIRNLREHSSSPSVRYLCIYYMRLFSLTYQFYVRVIRYCCILFCVLAQFGIEMRLWRERKVLVGKWKSDHLV